MAAESTFAVSSAAVLVAAVLISACCRSGCRCSYHDKFRYGTTSVVLRLECSIDCIRGSVGQQNKYFPFIFSLSVSFEEEQFSKKCNLKNLIGSVGHHQCYINWSSAPYPSYIQTFKRIR